MGKRLDRALDSKWMPFIPMALVLVMAVFLWLGKSYYEARTYSRLTGHQVEWTDALWVQLRVQAAPLVVVPVAPKNLEVIE